MRKTTIYYSLILAGALALCGCQEKVPAPGNGVLDAEIFLSAGTPATKGFIDSQEQFDNTATVIKVYDFVTGSDGEAGTAEAKHIDDAIHGLIARDGTWAYTSGDTHYHWTKKGTHRFFGWLTTAPDGTAFASASAPTWTEGFKTLSIPLTMDTTTPQFDFVYSDIVTRDSSDPNQHGKVELQFSHLFSALAVTMENISDDVIHLQDVSIQEFYNKRTATLNYNVAMPEGETVTDPGIAITGTEGSDFLVKTYPASLNKNDKIDLYTGTAAGTDHDFILMWPQSLDDMAGAKISVRYTVEDDFEEDGTTLKVHEKVLPLTGIGAGTNLFNEGMEAGKRYALNLQFMGKVINLTLNVLPWDYNEYNWDYESTTITTSDTDGELDFPRDYPGYDRSNRKVTLQDRGDVLVGTFRIVTPKRGSWSVTGYGSGMDYFTISPTEGTFDQGNAGVSVITFTVTPSQTSVPASTVELHFNVAIELNGEWVDANSEINRRNWRIVWER